MVITLDFLAKLIELIFTSSLPLITSDFNSFPEIRSSFFAFLKALVKFNFGPLFELQENYMNTILDCIIWSFRHELSNYSDLGLELLEEVLLNVNKAGQISNAFYSRYHMKILTDILDVMTDGFHKSGLDAQTRIFFILIHVTTQGVVYNPIAQGQPQNQPNSEYLYTFLVERLSNAFPNVHKSVTSQKVANWFKETNEKAFKLEVADYLVLINRFTAADISDASK
jgi:exportin-1